MITEYAKALEEYKAIHGKAPKYIAIHENEVRKLVQIMRQNTFFRTGYNAAHAEKLIRNGEMMFLGCKVIIREDVCA